jgi:flagellar hook-associated protein 1 FlgK
MSGLFASLSNSVSAMSAQSRSIEIAGKNLANVNNADYARQRVIYGDRGTVITPDGAESLGLEALGVQQLRDTLLDRQVVRESSLSAYYTTMQSAYQRAQAGLGQSIASTSSTGSTGSANDPGIAAAIDDFFNSFQALASNPTDSGQRQTLIQSANILTDRLQLADRRLAQIQSDLGDQVGSDVTTANGLLTTIADLNAQIARFEVNNPGSAVDLRDQRQTAIEKLGQTMSVTATEITPGQIQVTAKDGGGGDVILVSGGTVTNSLAFDGTNVTAGASATVLALTSGSIQGALDAGSGAVQTLRDNLNALAGQLVTSVNAAYGGSFFDLAGTTAATIALDPSVTAANLTAGTGAAGDNTIAAAVAQLASRPFSTAGATPDLIDGTFGSFFSSSVGNLGQALAGVNARAANQTGIETMVRSQREAVSGVNLDEEMASLMQYQRAFQASSRVFTTIDNLLDVVVNQLGR